MRYMMMAVAAALALGVGCSAQAEDCDATQTSMNECASKQYSALDAELNKQYQKQMTYLKTPAKRAALQEAQQKWIVFRNADCLYQAGKPQDGGSMWSLNQAQCLTAQTKVRAEQLKAYTACRQEGCPK